MRLPVVAIVGRPNVGKSTLFNRIAGRRISIVEDMPGVTRDRIYAEAVFSPDASDDLDVARILRKSGRPVLVAANKVDHTSHHELANAFYEIGLADVMPLSAAH